MQDQYRAAVRSGTDIPFICPVCICEVLEEVTAAANDDVSEVEVTDSPRESTRMPGDNVAMELMDVSEVLVVNRSQQRLGSYFL